MSCLLGPSLERLQELGFDENDCVLALDECRGDVESAATWLLRNAKPSQSAQQPTGTENKGKLSGFEVILRETSSFQRSIGIYKRAVKSFIDYLIFFQMN